MRSYRPEELFDADGALRAELARAGPRGRAADGRQPARQRRPAAARPRAARLPRLRGRRAERPAATHAPRRRACSARSCATSMRMDADRRTLPDLRARTRRRRTASAPCSRSPTARGRPSCCRPTTTSRPTGGCMEVPQRAPVPGLARGLPADRPPRPVQLLRGVHPHRRLDVQPARQVAEGHPRDPVAAADRVAELPADLARLAPGPQRLQPPGPGLHRPRRQQEGRDRPRLPAAGRQLPAVGRRPLPAQPRLRQRDRRRQAAGAAAT